MKMVCHLVIDMCKATYCIVIKGAGNFKRMEYVTDMKKRMEYVIAMKIVYIVDG